MKTARNYLNNGGRSDGSNYAGILGPPKIAEDESALDVWLNEGGRLRPETGAVQPH